MIPNARKLGIFCLRLACVGGCIFLVQAPLEPAAGEVLCDQWNAAALELNSKAPIWIDHMTRWDGVTVLCGRRVIQNTHFVRSRPSDLRNGWQERMRQKLRAISCGDARLWSSFAGGWTLSDVVEFMDGEKILLQLDCPAGRN